MGSPDLTPYSPRLLLQWEHEAPSARHRAVDATLVFADVSGFTRLSERLARTRGKAGAEEMTETIGLLFEDLLTVAAQRGGEMLKYGGDAVLLFFRGDDHAARAAAASWDMQRRLRIIGRVETGAGPVRLRMSVGMHSGSFDLFKVGGSHQELVIAGPATTETVRMEAAAGATEILVSAATAAALPDGVLGAERDGGRLLRRLPHAPTVAVVPALHDADPAAFVSLGLRQHLADGVVDPEHRLATVAFVQAMGMDTLLEEVSPVCVAEWLEETVTVVQDACAALDVTFLTTDLAADGTKFMLASGVPRAGDDDERRMLLALQRMIAAQTPLPLRAGVQRGHVFAAAVGPSFRKTYTTMGDVTNTAARVMGRAGAGEVLALGDVLDHARARFDVEQLPPFSAKGKAVPLHPFRVLGLAEEAPPPPAIQLPLTGRDDEIAALTAAVARARDGSGSLVEIVGEMGAGKTRLVDEVLRGCGVEPVIVHCEPYHQSTPFHPIRSLLRAELGEQDLVAAVEALAPELQESLPLLGSVLDVDVPDNDATRALEGPYRLQRSVTATVALLRALRRDLASFVIEDVHWMDEASALVLRTLEGVVGEVGWVVCVTRRDEAAPFTPAAPASVTLRLGPLTTESMATLVAHATVDAPLRPHERDALVGRAAGNPLFLTSLLDSTGDLASLPDSLEAIVAAQIDRLPPPERRLLRHAAVLGSRFDLETLGEVAGERGLAMAGARALTSRLQWLCIPEGAGRLRFRHQLIRDVAYEALPYRMRRELHALAGTVIEGRSTGDESAEVLSLHFLHAGEHERCWQHATVAAKRAWKTFANAEAVDLYERALESAKHLPSLAPEEVAKVWEAVSTCHTLLGSNDRARVALRHARRLASTVPERYADLCRREAFAAQRDGKMSATMSWIRRGFRAIRDVDGDEASYVRAELAQFAAWVAMSRAKVRQAQRWAHLANAEGQRANRRVEAWSLQLLNNIDATLGRPTDPERATTAIRILEEIGEHRDLATVLNNVGMVEYNEGRWSEAMRFFERSREVMHRIGNVLDAGYCTLAIAEILVEQGHVDEAEADLESLVPLWRSVDFALGNAYVANQMARVSARRGQHTDAIDLFASARAEFERNQLVAEALDADARTAECLLHVGEILQAREALAAALERDISVGGTRARPRLLRVLACCDIADGRVEDAWSTLDESLHLARETTNPHEVALTLEVFAHLGRPTASGEDPGAELRLLLDVLGIVSTPPPLPAVLAVIG